LKDEPLLSDKRWQGLLVIMDILAETLQKLEVKKILRLAQSRFQNLEALKSN
jgi:hypothetical protein